MLQCTLLFCFKHVVDKRNKAKLYTLCLKKVLHQAILITLSILNKFSKNFYCHILHIICDKTVNKDLTTPNTCHYTTLQKLYVILFFQDETTLCFIKRCFFLSSITQSNDDQFARNCSIRSFNSKYINKIWPLVKYFLLIVMQRWRHNVSWV